MRAQMAAGKSLKDAWKFDRIVDHFSGLKYTQFKSNILAKLSAGKTSAFGVFRGICELEDKNMATITGVKPRTTLYIQTGAAALDLRLLTDVAVANIKPDCEVTATSCVLHFTQLQWDMLCELLLMQYDDWSSFAGCAPRCELTFSLAASEILEQLEFGGHLPGTISLFDPPLQHIVGIGMVSGRSWSPVSGSATLALLAKKLALLKGVVKDLVVMRFVMRY